MIKSTQNPKLKISSRYGNNIENAELRNFIFFLDAFYLSHYLTDIFYDSKCQVCFYDFAPMAEETRLIVANKVDRLAKISLSQYQSSGGIIWHGVGMMEGCR